jgi:hypothetical protein
MGFPSKKRPKASVTAEKNTHDSDSPPAQCQGTLAPFFITENSVAAASGHTSALIKEATVGAARQHQAHDILRRSMREHCEKLSSLDTTGFSVAIPLSSMYYNAATVWLQGFYCPGNSTNFFDNCVFSVLQLYKSGSSLPLQSEDGSMWTTVRATAQR